MLREQADVVDEAAESAARLRARMQAVPIQAVDWEQLVDEEMMAAEMRERLTGLD